MVRAKSRIFAIGFCGAGLMLASTKPKDKNLVSVLVRTTFRRHFRARYGRLTQSHWPIEIVLRMPWVEASPSRVRGRRHRIRSNFQGHALSRSAAANVAIAAARGSLLVFLTMTTLLIPVMCFADKNVGAKSRRAAGLLGLANDRFFWRVRRKVHEHSSPMRLFRRNYLTMGSVLSRAICWIPAAGSMRNSKGWRIDFWLQALRHTRSPSAERTPICGTLLRVSPDSSRNKQDESRFRQAQSLDREVGRSRSWGRISAISRILGGEGKIGETQAAETDYRRALAIDPDSVNVLNRFALLLVKQRRFAEGDSLLTRATGSDPQNTDLRINRAVLFETAGRKKCRANPERNPCRGSPA